MAERGLQENHDNPSIFKLLAVCGGIAMSHRDKYNAKNYTQINIRLKIDDPLLQEIEKKVMESGFSKNSTLADALRAGFARTVTKPQAEPRHESHDESESVGRMHFALLAMAFLVFGFCLRELCQVYLIPVVRFLQFLANALEPF